MNFTNRESVIKHFMSTLIFVIASTSTVLFSCQEEDLGIQEQSVSNSLELKEYLQTGLELVKAYDDLTERLSDIDLDELETGIAANGMRYRKLPISKEVNRLTVKLNEKKEVLISKFPSLKKMISERKTELIHSTIYQSIELKDQCMKLKRTVDFSVNRLKSDNIEAIYTTSSQVVGVLSGYMSYEQIEVMAYILEDGTAVYFLCDQNTIDYCYGYAPSAGGYYNGKKITTVLHAHDTETGENFPSTYDNYAMTTYYTQYSIPFGIIYGSTICYYYD